MKKLLTISVLALACLLLYSAAAPAGGHWASGDIRALEQKGFINANDYSNPDDNATRAEFINLFLSVVISPDAANIKGGLFNSSEPITRADAIYTIVTALKLDGEAEGFRFSDVSPASTYIYAAYDAGLIKGYPGGSFNRSNHLTKAECLTIINRISDKIGEDENMNLETERKFLISADNVPYDLSRAQRYDITQTYINYSPEARVRNITNHGFWFAIKMPKDAIGLSRLELEFAITAEEYYHLYDNMAEHTLQKTRYQFMQGEHSVSVDIYDGDLKGLAVSEIEFANVEAANQFVPYDWYIEDITSDSRYKNANLARYGMPED